MAAEKYLVGSRLVFRFERGTRSLNNLKLDATADNILHAYESMKILFDRLPLMCMVVQNNHVSRIA